MFFDPDPTINDFYEDEESKFVNLNIVTADGVEMVVTLHNNNEYMSYYDALQLTFSMFNHNKLIPFLDGKIAIIEYNYLPSGEILH